MVACCKKGPPLELLPSRKEERYPRAALYRRQACQVRVYPHLVLSGFAGNFVPPLSCRDFRARNPAIAQFDKFLTGQGDPRPVSALFAAIQREHMKVDRSEETSYALARIWLKENGYEILERMGIKLTDPEGDAARSALIKAHQEAMRQEAERIKRALEFAAALGVQTMPADVKRAIRERAGSTAGLSPQFRLQPTAGQHPPPIEPPQSDIESE